jgi:hypothetical protein
MGAPKFKNCRETAMTKTLAGSARVFVSLCPICWMGDGQIPKLRRGATARKRTPKRLMTGVESTELLESAKRALAMVKGVWIAGGRVSVRQAGPASARGQG